MTKERWMEVKGKLLDTFTDATVGERNEGIEHIEWVEFVNQNNQRMRLEWHDSPKKLGERTITSKRIGANVSIEPEYSDTDRIQRIVLRTFDEQSGDWREGDASSFK